MREKALFKIHRKETVWLKLLKIGQHKDKSMYYYMNLMVSLELFGCLLPLSWKKEDCFLHGFSFWSLKDIKNRSFRFDTFWLDVKIDCSMAMLMLTLLYLLHNIEWIEELLSVALIYIATSESNVYHITCIA